MALETGSFFVVIHERPWQHAEDNCGEEDRPLYWSTIGLSSHRVKTSLVNAGSFVQIPRKISNV
jgi:hypothetical protein